MGLSFGLGFAADDDGGQAPEGGKVAAAAFGDFKVTDTDKLAEKYSEENADPVNAAKDGYIDNIIEPQFVRAYVISALQTLVR